MLHLVDEVELEGKCVKLHFGCSSIIHATLGKLFTTRKRKAVLESDQENLNFKYATDLKLGNLLTVVPKHLAPETSFMEESFSMAWGRGMVWRSFS